MRGVDQKRPVVWGSPFAWEEKPSTMEAKRERRPVNDKSPAQQKRKWQNQSVGGT